MRYDDGSHEDRKLWNNAELENLATLVVDLGYQLHKELGPGLLESVYEVLLARALERRGISVERQKVVSFEYDGLRFEEGFRLDLLVGGALVVELKSVAAISPVQFKQLLTYLRLLNLPLRLLVNFGAASFKEGIRRAVNNYLPGETSWLRARPR